MPKFVVATKSDTGERVVRTSMPHIKAAIKEYPAATWSIKVYNQKFDLANVCKLLENLTSVQPEEAYAMKVTESGQCRKE